MITRSSTSTPEVTDKEELFRILDDEILQKGITELHTHLMGMGSADLWVSKIMESYLPRKFAANGEQEEVYYPLKSLLMAAGFSDPDPFHKLLEESLFEAYFFDGFPNYNLNMERVVENIDEKDCISNSTIVAMLHDEDKRLHRKGPFRALVRNWFEFLSTDGQSASHTQVLQTYRGNFFPEFYPQRFIMKDSIVDTCPEVLGILLNSTCARYARAGVNYIEYSVSCGDILKPAKFDAMNKQTFSTHMFKVPKEREAQEQKSGGGQEQFSGIKRKLPGDANISQGIPKADAIANANAPVLPASMAMKNPSPAWRKYVDYSEHSTKQKFTFLAAFTRDKPTVGIKQGTVYCTIRSNQWLAQDPQPTSHRDVYAELGKIAGDSAAIAQFLSSAAPSEPAPAATGAGPAALSPLEAAPTPELDQHDQTCVQLRALAKVLCQDNYIAEMYPHFVDPGRAIDQLCAIDQLYEKMKDPVYVQAVVGLDWVGDELGHPFCVFSHNKFVNFVVHAMGKNSCFGVRIHAGEGPIRPSTRDALDSPLRLAFYLHMYIVTEGIRLYHAKLSGYGLSPRIRIGHGVAFLFGCEDKTSTQFAKDMEEFREFLRENNIVCELCPTSNHMLLPSTFQQDGNLQNQRTLKCFLKEKLPVVLGTDDDGIWAIHKCQRHYHHVSVAGEYCQAIECGDIATKQQLEGMLKWGRDSVFAQQPV